MHIHNSGWNCAKTRQHTWWLPRLKKCFFEVELPKKVKITPRISHEELPRMSCAKDIENAPRTYCIMLIRGNTRYVWQARENDGSDKINVATLLKLVIKALWLWLCELFVFSLSHHLGCFMICARSRCTRSQPICWGPMYKYIWMDMFRLHTTKKKITPLWSTKWKAKLSGFISFNFERSLRGDRKPPRSHNNCMFMLFLVHN